MKVTARNKMGCAAAHNDRDFEIEKESHIDISRTHMNIYENIYGDNSLKFKDLEMQYYKEHYSKRLEELNKNAIKNRHRDQVQTMSKYMKNHGPEELLLQIGGKNDYIDPEIFKDCVEQFLKEMEKYSSNCHIVDYAIHLDEKTPHAHVRKVWDFTNENGVLEVGKGNALKELGIEPPYPNQPEDKYNNRAISFDDMCREIWAGIAEEHGFMIERTTEREFNKNKKDLAISDYKEEKTREDLELIRERYDTLESLEKEFEEKKVEYERQLKELSEREKELQAKEEKTTKEMATLTAQLVSLQKELEGLDDKVSERKQEIKELRKAKEKEMREIGKLPKQSQKNIEKESGVKLEKDKELEIK